MSMRKALLAVPVILGILHAQAKFDVASVKPHELNGWTIAAVRESRIAISGNRISTSGTALGLIMAAYKLRTYQVAGAAKLADKSGSDQMYDVEARAPGDGVVLLDQAREILQSLLADRFQLKFHRESKELPAYRLVTAGGASKLKPSSPDVQSKTDPLPAGVGMVKAHYVNVSLPELVIRLAPHFDRPLFDRTGLEGGYEFTLEYAALSPANMSPEEAAALKPVDGPPLKVALEEQLGLKVAPAKETVELLVIDHLERPSGN